MAAFLKRLKEPSTWAGLAALAALFGVSPAVTGAVVQAASIVTDSATTGGVVGVVQAVTGLCGVAAVLLPEHKEPK